MTDAIHASHLGAVYVSEESSFCTVGTERRCFPVVDTVELTPEQAELDVMKLRACAWEVSDPVTGLKSVSGKFSYYLQVPSTVMNAAATPDTDANAPLRLLLRCSLGGESIAAGTDVDTGSSSTAFSVTAGQGSRIPEGQLILVNDATSGFQACRVQSQSTDAITVWPALTGTPSSGDDVRNLMTFYPTPTNSRSVSVGLATAQDSNEQWRALGCTLNVALKFERGALAMADFTFAGASWTGPDALSLSTACTTDPMAAPLSCRNVLFYLQPPATTTRTVYAVDSVTVTLNTGMGHIESLAGGTEGRRAVHRTDGLTGSFATIEVTAPYDSGVETWWQNRTELSMFMVIPYDASASSRRAIVVDVPSCRVIGKPRVVKGAGNLSKMTFTLRAYLDGGSGNLASAPFRLGLG